MKQVINNMNGQIQDEVNSDTNYLIMGDHDFFRHDNEDLEGLLVNILKMVQKSNAYLKVSS